MRTFNMPALDAPMAEYGWVVTGVPGLALYTVGLTDKFKHPELMIQGLPVNVADGIIRSAVELIASGTKLAAGSRYDNIIQKYPVKMLRVHPSNYVDWVGMAAKYYDYQFDMLQILWPDRSGRYPGDVGALFTDQLRFDVRRPEYDETPMEHGHNCACCHKEI